MSAEVKPWMRRAAEDLDDLDHPGGKMKLDHVDEIAEAIAAHAPPVENLMEALSGLLEIAELAMPDTCYQSDHRCMMAQSLLARYDAWAAREAK